MRVLFYNHSGPVSGAERVLLLAIKGLDKTAFEPTVVSPEGALQHEVGSLGVPWARIDELTARFTKNPYKLLLYGLSLIRTVSSLRSKIRSIGPDVIHANSIRAGIAAAIASIGTDRPVVWHVHDELQEHPLSTLIRWIASWPRCKVVAVSKATAVSFAGGEEKASRITVVHNGVDLEAIDAAPVTGSLRADLSLHEQTFLFAIIGQITPRKGQLELVRAFSRVAAQAPDAKLIVVGSPIFNNDALYLDEVRSEVRLQRLEDKVLFLGQRSDIARIMKQSDVVVINSKSEAFVMVAIEAMACGTPVIATDVGGTREMIEDRVTGWLVESGNEDMLVAAMVDSHKNRERRESCAKRSREKVETYLNSTRFEREFSAAISRSGEGRRSVTVQNLNAETAKQ